MKNIFLKTDTRNLKQKTLIKINKYNLCVVKNFIKINQIKKIFDILKRENNIRKDIRLSGKFIYKMKDYKRLDIGDSYKNTRFSRYIVLNEWNKKNKNFYNLIKPMIDFRNEIAGVQKKRFIYKEVGGDNKSFHFCDLVRMIQYPRGGGFLAEHDDHDKYYCKGVYQALLPLTVKKTQGKKRQFASYETGGLYIDTKKNKIFIDDYIKAGDLLLFDPRLPHGINSVDSMKKLNISGWNGRLTLAFSISNFLK